MKFKIAAVTMFAAFVSGCATQSPQIKSTESSHSQAEQLQAQKQAVETHLSHQP
ncbi:hypothetical protein ACGDLY_013785 [Vibrio campbellii]